MPKRSLLVVLLVPAVSMVFATDQTPGTRVQTTRFTYTAAAPDVPAGVKTVDMWLPVPSDSPWQRITDLAVDAPYPYQITTERKFGNRMVFVRAENRRTPLQITVSFVVERTEATVLGAPPGPSRRNGSNGKHGLKPDRLVPTGGRFLRIAQDVAAGQEQPLDKARAIFNHVVSTMQYDYKKESPKLGNGDVAFVCDYKKGNCSDLHSYFISLARSVGIPAVLEYGFPVAGIPLASPIPEEGTIAGYHCWTWMYDKRRGWVPLDASDARRWQDSGRADISERLFGNLVLERSAVAMSRGRDLTLEPPQSAGPLNYFIYPYAEADGKPVMASWELKYKLLEST